MYLQYMVINRKISLLITSKRRVRELKNDVNNSNIIINVADLQVDILLVDNNINNDAEK